MMYKNFIGAILFITIIGNLEFVIGSKSFLKWVPVNSGDELPENVVLIEGMDHKYVGRARHFDEILPAEISANGTALISSCQKEILKKNFEILTTTFECEWISYSDKNYNDFSENIVRVGTAWDGEPIFVGKSDMRYNNYITGIYLTSKKTYPLIEDNYYDNVLKYLRCDTEAEWIDTSSTKLPVENAISGGKTEDGYAIYVARLKRDCEIVTGQVIPELGSATAFLNSGQDIQSAYCQVLVGKTDEYKWVSAGNGDIPDYAVVHGKYFAEPEYVSRFDGNVTHLSYSKTREIMNYEILVRTSLHCMHIHN